MNTVSINDINSYCNFLTCVSCYIIIFNTTTDNTCVSLSRWTITYNKINCCSFVNLVAAANRLTDYKTFFNWVAMFMCNFSKAKLWSLKTAWCSWFADTCYIRNLNLLNLWTITYNDLNFTTLSSLWTTFRILWNDLIFLNFFIEFKWMSYLKSLLFKDLCSLIIWISFSYNCRNCNFFSTCWNINCNGLILCDLLAFFRIWTDYISFFYIFILFIYKCDICNSLCLSFYFN